MYVYIYIYIYIYIYGLELPRVLTDDCHLVFCWGNTKQIKSVKRQPNYNICYFPCGKSWIFVQ